MENVTPVEKSELLFRKATKTDLQAIVELLSDDVLGQNRDSWTTQTAPLYMEAFCRITKDPNHFLVCVEYRRQLIGTCHLTLIPSLTFTGTLRLHIEAVRILSTYRGMGIGKWMLEQACNWGLENGATLVQLATNASREETKLFYKNCGFEASHVGMKKKLKKRC